MLIDTHVHLDCRPLADELPAVLERAAAAGVSQYVIPGVAEAGWQEIAAVAARYPTAGAAFGLHPMHAVDFTNELPARLEAFLAGAVAVGEIGLDYIVPAKRVAQREAFRSQLRLAVRLGLPVILHCRRAFRDLLAICREERIDRVGGVMHAFSGSVETMRECLALGLHIGVAGPVTRENAVKPVEVARLVPPERLLLETDAPDLTPEPHRGRPNEPAYLVEIALRVAEIRGVTVGELVRVTTENAGRLFSL